MNKQLGDLISRMTELEKLYIPSEEDQLGDYSSTDEDNARAYTLLAHAEIESYLENLSQRASDAAVSFANSNEYNELVAHYIFNAGKKPKVTNQNHGSLDGIARCYGTICREESGKNHGIKERNFKSLFEPYLLPKRLDDYSELLAALNTLGTRRGEYAHHNSMGISMTVNPFDCKNEVAAVLHYLADFSDSFESYINFGIWPEQ